MKTPARPSAVLAACSVVCLAAGAARATDTFIFTLGGKGGGSALTADLSATTDFEGFLIGNYDPEKNPGGTRTRLTLFGEGNNPVPLSGTGGAEGIIDTAPSGTFTLHFDVPTLTATLTGLSVDLIGAGNEPPSVESEATVMFPTFYTSNPFGFFPGGSFTIPLGEADVTVLTATQKDAATGPFVPTGPDEVTFAIPVEVTVVSQVTFAGEPVETEPQVVPIVLVAVVTFAGEAATADFSFNVSVDETVEGPIEGPRALPFEDPIFGADLLVTLTIESATVTLEAGLTASAAGVKEANPCPPDFNQDGDLNSDDYFAFLTDFFAGHADFNDDGMTNSDDYFAFLTAFFQGCV